MIRASFILSILQMRVVMNPLVVSKSENSVFCKLLCSIDREATGAWLCTLMDYFGRIGRRSDQVIPVKFCDVRSMVVSGDGKYVYSASLDRYVRIHELRIGSLVIKLTAAPTAW